MGFGYVLPVLYAYPLLISMLGWVLWRVGDMISTGNRELRCPVGGMGGGCAADCMVRNTEWGDGY